MYTLFFSAILYHQYIFLLFDFIIRVHVYNSISLKNLLKSIKLTWAEPFEMNAKGQARLEVCRR